MLLIPFIESTITLSICPSNLIYLNHGAESFLRSQPGFSQSRNSPHFVGTEGSLPHSQAPATCPYPEPARSSPYPHTSLPEDPSYFIPMQASVFQVVSFLQVSPSKPCIHPACVTCPAHLSLLDLITRTVLGKEYRSLSSQLLSFPHSFVTSSLLGPNLSLTPHSQTSSAYVPPSMCATKFHTHVKNRQYYNSVGLSI